MRTLLDLYNKLKEKYKMVIEEKLDDKYEEILEKTLKKFIVHDYISKDKIREKRRKLEIEYRHSFGEEKDFILYQILVLDDLLMNKKEK